MTFLGRQTGVVSRHSALVCQPSLFADMLLMVVSMQWAAVSRQTPLVETQTGFVSQQLLFVSGRTGFAGRQFLRMAT
jgi:hypothetical protein